jgi:hypothetical protein
MKLIAKEEVPMRKQKLFAVVLVCLEIQFPFSSKGGEVSGKLSYDDGSPVVGQVSVGVVSDPNDALSSAIGNVIRTGRQSVRIVRSDTNGVYQLANVPEGTNVLLMADDERGFRPTLATQLNLVTGQIVSNLNFTFAKNPSGATNIVGTITINGQQPTNEVDGTISAVKGDMSIGSMSLFGRHPTDTFEFTDLPSGNYKLRACYAQSSNTVTCISTNIVVPTSGSITVNLNISTP